MVSNLSVQDKNTSPVWEIFCVFLRLGLTSFGGPIAHLGYFESEFVVRRKWLDAKAYADLVALCQFLPGPASSQVGFALGLSRGGLLGAGAAWFGFTLPSAVALILCAYASRVIGGMIVSGLLQGLMIAAVAVVTGAVWTMGRKLCPDWQRLSIALTALGIASISSLPLPQMIVIALGAAAGFFLCPSEKRVDVSHVPASAPSRLSYGALGAYFVILLGLPLLAAASQNPALAVVNAFYHAGALVFGGGHVVLPMLHSTVVGQGWVDDPTFFAGYGAAQAVPGPLFTFAAYLGILMKPAPHGVVGAALCLIAIFTPGFLLLIGVLPLWDRLKNKPAAQSCMAGVHASVVGLLAATLYAPLAVTTLRSLADLGIAAAAFVLLVFKGAPSWLIVILCLATETLVAWL